MRAVLHRLLFPMAFVLPIWILAWWMGHGAAPAGLIALLIAMPGAFIVAFGCAVLVWLRPDVREARALTWPDAAWIGGSWLAWLVGGALPGVASVVVMFAAFWLSVVAIAWLRRRLRAEAERRLAGQGPGPAGRGPAGRTPASGPDAGKVITVLPSDHENDAENDGDGRMPGSTRVGEAKPPRVDDVTPGSNFGANRAPVSRTWDPARPVPGRFGSPVVQRDADAPDNDDAPAALPDGPDTEAELEEELDDLATDDGMPEADESRS